MIREVENKMLQLDWIKNTQNDWLNPANTNWNTVYTEGVYLIWQTGTLLTGPRYIKVGQGDVRDRMQAHMRDYRISQYNDLRFTFASVGLFQRDGVERYLGDVLRPLVAERFPDVRPIAVNLPLVA